jgi:hypothetical protein
MLANDPLLDVAVSMVQEECATLDTATASSVRLMLSGFISGALPYPDARRAAVGLVGAADFVDKLHQILSCPDQPLPEWKTRSPLDVNGTRRQTQSWTSQEDVRLLAGVHRFGGASSCNWSAVAQFVGNGRTRSQCSQRWIRVLDPRISTDQWTSEQDKRLLELVAQLGEKAWMKVAARLGNRSDVQCRYHYIQMQRDGYRAQPPPPPVPQAGAGDDIHVIDQGLGFNPFFPIEEHQNDSDAMTAGQRLFEITEEVPIPLTTSLDLKQPDDLFDSNLWLLRFE